MPILETQTLEAMPVKELACRIQANPELAGELPLAEQMPDGESWNRKARFVLETALIRELDDRRLIESIPDLAAPPTTFCELEDELSAAFDPRAAELLGEIHQSAEWKMFFWRSSMLDLPPAWPQDPLEAYTEVISEQTGVMVSHVKGMAGTIRSKYGIMGGTETAAILRNHMPFMWGKIGYRGFYAAQALLDDLDSDRNDILRLDNVTRRLGFAKPLGQCPAGEDGATVHDLDEAAEKDRLEPIGCPAFIGSRLAQKLLHRAIDEAEAARLLEVA